MVRVMGGFTSAKFVAVRSTFSAQVGQVYDFVDLRPAKVMKLPIDSILFPGASLFSQDAPKAPATLPGNGSDAGNRSDAREEGRMGVALMDGTGGAWAIDDLPTT